MEERGIVPDFSNPDFDTERVREVALALGVPLIILWAFVVPVCLLVCVKGCGSAGRWDRQYIRKTPVAIFIGILWVFVEFCQINWFTFATSVPWKGQDLLYFLDFFQLNFSISWEAWFWIFVSYSMLVIIVVLLLLCCCEGGEEANVAAGILFLTMIPIFQPMMQKMMEALVCTYPIDQPPFMDMKPNIVCWEGIHILYVTFAVIVISVFYPSISITMALLIGGRRDAHVALAFGVIQFKLLQVFIFAFFSSYILAILLGLGGINIVYFIISLLLPSKYRLVDMTRSAAMALCIWAVVSTLIAYGINDEESWVALILLIIGWLLIPIITYVIRRFCCGSQEPNQKGKDVERPPSTVVTTPPPVVPIETPKAPPEVINIHLTQVQGPLNPDGSPQYQTHTIQVPLNQGSNTRLSMQQQQGNQPVQLTNESNPPTPSNPTPQPAYPVGPPS